LDLPDLYDHFRTTEKVTNPALLKDTRKLKTMTENILGISPQELIREEMFKYRTATEVTGELLSYAASDAFYTLCNTFAIFLMCRTAKKNSNAMEFKEFCREFTYASANHLIIARSLKCKGPTAEVPLIMPATSPLAFQCILHPHCKPSACQSKLP
jgi:hypothetical protein